MGYVAKLLWYFIVYTVMIVPALILDGLAVMKLYQWFITTTFTSAPTLHFVAAIGLSLFVGFISRQFIYTPKTDADETVRFGLYALSFLYFTPLFSLLIGWIVHSYFL